MNDLGKRMCAPRSLNKETWETGRAVGGVAARGANPRTSTQSMFEIRVRSCRYTSLSVCAPGWRRGPRPKTRDECDCDAGLRCLSLHYKVLLELNNSDVANTRQPWNCRFAASPRRIP